MSATQKKFVSFLRRTKASAQGQLPGKREKMGRNTPSPFTKRQEKLQTEVRAYKIPLQQNSKKYLIPISQKMRSKASHTNLYKSYQQTFLTFDGLETVNQLKYEQFQKEANGKIREIKNQSNLKRQTGTPIQVKIQKKYERSHKMQAKLYQMPIKSNKLSEKISKNMVSILKIPNIDPSATGDSRNFHSLYQIQDYVQKHSASPKIQLANQQTQEDKEQSCLKNKKCSIIPALHLSTHYKQKKSPQRQKNMQTHYDFALIKKVRKEIENCLVVQSKQQKIIANSTIRNGKLYNNKTAQKKQFQLKITKKNHQSQIKHQSFYNVNDFINSAVNQMVRSERIDQRNLNNYTSDKAKVGTNIAFCVGNGVEKGVYEKKISSYRQFLFMVNFAHRIFDPLNILDPAFLTKAQKNAINKYYYYVGHGNNSMLVRSLMKRRIWWEQTYNVVQADFVWTQLKIQHLIQSQPKFQQQVPVQNSEQIEEQVNQINKIIEKTQKVFLKTYKKSQYLTIQKIPTLERLEPYLGKNSNLQKSNMPKGLMFKAPFAAKKEEKILTKKDFLLYKSILTSVYTDGYENYQARMKNLPKGFLKSQSSQTIKVNNHFEGNHSLGNKKALLHHLLFYYKITNVADNNAFPKTFHIKQIDNDLQFKLFVQQYKRIQTTCRDLKNIWILKPGQNSNRGKGITVVRDLRQIKQQIRPKEKHKNGQSFTYILQKYIERPLLYKGRKFDIRHYLVITRLYGKMRAYWYGQGYIRTSSTHFQLQNIRDPMIHLTNDAIQKNSQDYGYYEDGNKVSYNQIQKYFNKHQPQRHFQFNKIYQQMRSLCLDAVKATFMSLDPQKRLHNFQVFGLDFMIDEKMKVYLIQINTNPCLQLSSSLLERVIPSMLQQSFRLAIDPLFPPTAHYTNNTRYMAPDCAMQKFQFQLIFDESRDGNALKKLYEQNSVAYDQMMASLIGSEKQQDDVYDNEGEQIQIDKII